MKWSGSGRVGPAGDAGRRATNQGRNGAGRQDGRLRSALGAAVAAALLAAASAQAGALYRWESQDGTVSYTDDAKRIPERYRASAEPIGREAIEGYGRITPTDPEATASYTERLAARLASLRAANAESEAPPEAAPPPQAGSVQRLSLQRNAYRPERRPVRLRDGSIGWRRYGDHRTVTAPLPDHTIAADPTDPHPVVVEKHRVRVPGNPITQTITVTRQGDRVLSVVKPRSHYHTLDFGEMSDFEGGLD